MTHYLPAVGLLAAVAVVVFVGTLLIREDATTTDGTAAPERSERRAIGTAEDPKTTDGAAAPERNERGAISAAAFLGAREANRPATRRRERTWSG